MQHPAVPDSERVERDALSALFRAAPQDVREALGLAALESGGMLQGVARALPASAIVVNRVLGLGLEVAAHRSRVSAIVDAYRDAGVARYFVQVHPEARPADLRDALSAAGLEKARGWQKFQRDVSPPRPARGALACRRIDGVHGADFARIACDAFDLGDAARAWLAHLPECPGWHAFMSFDGDTPAGTGALYVENGFGWLDFGATAPAFRRQGSQSALMAARVAHAAGLGCHTLLTCTGEDVPGDPQHSYGNILRAGFRPTYLRENWAPPRA